MIQNSTSAVNETQTMTTAKMKRDQQHIDWVATVQWYTIYNRRDHNSMALELSFEFESVIIS